MEVTTIAGADLKVSRLGLGTWAMGGRMWGGSDDDQSISTIQTAIDGGITLIDTAPVYGFGRSEEIVGRVFERCGMRHQVTLATQAGLNWQSGKPFRDASRKRIFAEVEDSLRRLRTNFIDLYQVRWPDLRRLSKKLLRRC